ncbi:hypothetical protein BABINDRAFT_109915 [Babjeviella inositovora NRRL Y-12698]|uniref:Actin-like protein ARP9 n=1 Tax=Babjeviella inositovora NRRL Y-12698 TaxID=984486 RepID=A0A1E3QVI1_9ASCO|nr:uncharacterized protein BABINDRAFT_109915 [Babjeviella inositovora NRRL Y-12698]ODQ81668.1 hypothetical protein BABINDRAFT_109915 [Babjeviella inositovora NRRL Y-12698]
MVHYKEENYLIIQPGSQSTYVSFGLEDSLAPPAYVFPTKVYQSGDNFSCTDSSLPEVYPIVGGEIINIEALKYLIKVIVKSLNKQFPLKLTSLIPLLLLSSFHWSRLHIEQLTQYALEDLQFLGFNILPTCLGNLFSVSREGLATATVIDIGYERTEITPIIDYLPARFASTTVKLGGQSIDQEIRRYLPDFSPLQIDALKKSDIFEVLSHADKISSFYGLDELTKEEEGILDVAAIVTSNNTKEIIEGKKKKEKTEKPNSELEINTFPDPISGEDISVGLQRFRGCEPLLEAISHHLYIQLGKIDDLAKRQELWDNLIVVGPTTLIKGFTEALLVQLGDDWLVVPPNKAGSNALAAFQATSALSASGEQFNLQQVPRSLKPVKVPEYFPEWKSVPGSFENCLSVLGGQIYCKQIFGELGEDSFVTKDSYDDKGPLLVWDVCLS